MNVQMINHTKDEYDEIYTFTDIDDGLIPGDGKVIRRTQNIDSVWWHTKGNCSWIMVNPKNNNISLYESYYNEYIIKNRKKKLDSL